MTLPLVIDAHLLFLLHLLLLILPLFLYVLFYFDQPFKRHTIPEPLLIVALSVLLLITLYTPIEIHGGIRFDLRLLPMIIGFLFLGPKVGLSLFLIYGFMRIVFFPYEHITLVTVPYILLYFFLWFVYPYFVKGSLKQKAFFITFIHVFYLFIFTANIRMLRPIDSLEFLIITDLAAMQLLFLLLVTYFLEKIKKNAQLRQDYIQLEKSKVLSEMASTVAHEVKNPLTTVQGFVQLLGNEKVDTTKKEWYVSIVLEELKRAEGIITDYLSLSKHTDEITTLIVKEEVSYAVEIMKPFAMRFGVNIITDINTDGKIEGNSQKLRQSLINIIKNGVEAMESSGGTLEVKAVKEGETVIISISDEGAGMTRDQINQLGSFYSTKETGSGIGTMVTRSIIEQMKGTVTYESEKSKGTTVQLTLPLSGAETGS
ncbi:ATP-binding protein [Bacillus sp. FJAT-44742]|uniref:ATP-binding protein n=1 Tax=Bacillus sp. FJAT-44742 TaxID=2014005 RepID=UPI0018E26294|nr:sensor histidine kinase [Bacillus sp. FJAT-44742]